MRVLLRDILELDFLFVNVVPHHNVAQVKVGGGAERKVRDDEPIGPSPSLVNDDEVGHVVCSTSFNQLKKIKTPITITDLSTGALSYLFVLVVTPVEPLGVGEEQSDFLYKFLQSRRRVV